MVSIIPYKHMVLRPGDCTEAKGSHWLLHTPAGEKHSFRSNRVVIHHCVMSVHCCHLVLCPLVFSFSQEVATGYRTIHYEPESGPLTVHLWFLVDFWFKGVDGKRAPAGLIWWACMGANTNVFYPLALWVSLQ